MIETIMEIILGFNRAVLLIILYELGKRFGGRVYDRMKIRRGTLFIGYTHDGGKVRLSGPKEWVARTVLEKGWTPEKGWMR